MIDGPVIRTVASRFQPSLFGRKGGGRSGHGDVGSWHSNFRSGAAETIWCPLKLNMILVHRFALRREYFRR
jgi:hypothetical protein